MADNDLKHHRSKGLALTNTAATPVEGSDSPDGDSLTIGELRGEISSLRRELRLLRVAHAELERLAIRDTLTPLFNRRYFQNAINERIARAKRYSTKAAILFIDVNKMKKINDLFGHSAGDYALLHTARTIQAHIRATDVAARIGGDEFAIILEEVTMEQAAAKADQLAEVLHDTPFMFGDQPLTVSASIGVAMLHPNDTEDSLIERADADMYARKRAWHQGQDPAGKAASDKPRNNVA